MRLLSILLTAVTAITLFAQAELTHGMADIPAAIFTMGTDSSQVAALMVQFNTRRREMFASELPAHRAEVTPFAIDRTEVTNAAFKGFLDAHPEWTAARIPPARQNGDYLKTWSGGTYPAGEANLPVTFMTWDAATAFCKSQGKRLPTEAEWEFAASGGRRVEFPWGDAMPDKTSANWSGAGIGRAAPVGSFPAASGLYDMAGNVWEFVQDEWTASYADSTRSPGRRVIRGGSFEGAAINLRVRFRDSHPEIGAGPHVGFRCAK